MSNVTLTVGDGKTYSSLNAALAAYSSSNLTTDCCGTGSAGILTIECYAISGGDITAADTGTGYTTSASYYINITSPATDRHAGEWNTAKYYLNLSTGGLSNQEAYTRISYLQIQGTSSSSQNLVVNTADQVSISNNIIRKNGGGGSSNKGINTGATSGLYVYVYNNLIYDISGLSGNAIYGGGTTGSYYRYYNNTIHNCPYAFYTLGSSARTILKNNLVQSLGTGYFSNYAGVDLTNSGYNLTEGTLSALAFGITADSGTTTSSSANKLIETGQNFTSTVKVGMIVKNTTDTTYAYVTAIDSDTQLTLSDDIMASSEAYTIYCQFYGNVTFADEANDDFHLASGDTAAKDKGADCSSDANLSFNTDIDGQTRSGTWDIGADEYVSSGYSETLTIIATSASTLSDLQTYKETMQVAITSVSTLAEAQAMLESVLTTIQSSSVLADIQTYTESMLTTIQSASSVIDQLAGSYTEEITTTIQSLSTLEDKQAYVETLTTLIQSDVSVTDIKVMIESLLTIAQSSSTVVDTIGVFENLQSIIISASAVNETQIFVETLQAVIQSSSTVVDALSTFLEEVSTTILSISSLDDRQLFIENISIMALSSVSLTEIMTYVEAVQTTAVAGISLTDILVGEFIGTYIHGEEVEPRSFTTEVVARSFTTEVRPR